MMCVLPCSFGHVVAVVGYNFSSSDASQHYWLIKDSLPGVGAGQYWKVSQLTRNDPIMLCIVFGGKLGTVHQLSSNRLRHIGLAAMMWL